MHLIEIHNVIVEYQASAGAVVIFKVVFHLENLKPPIVCSDIHKEAVVARKVSLGNSEGVNINLCQYSDIFSTSEGSSR